MSEAPETIGKYPIAALLAKGGMGAVYKAVHPTLRRAVVLKKLTVKGNPQFIERFKREARIMMDFKHDNIVTVYDHFKEGTSYYIVQEYVDGGSLEELIRRERGLPSTIAMRIFLQVARALKYAHDRGVIHRDIKPANVLLTKEGDAKLVDFGIASYEEEDETESLTGHGMTLGTPSYMPPEQFEDTRSVDKCADIYAMGVVLYEMVTAKKPFPGNFAPDTINLIQKGRYVRVKRMNPGVDPVIARLIGKMIRPKKSQRFQDLAPVIKLLERRLRKEDQGELDRHLVHLMKGQPYTPKKPKGRVLKRVLAVAIPLLVLASPVAAWYAASGAWHEWFDPADWGSFTVAVQRPASLPAASGSGAEDSLPLSVELFAEKGAAVDRAAALQLPGPTRKAARTLSRFLPSLKGWAQDRTDRIYVRPGFYRLKIQSGNKLLWDSFYLPPIPLLRAEGKRGGLELSYRLSEPLPKPVTFKSAFVDERLGKSLDAQVRLEMRSLSGEWTPLSSVPPEGLLSGRVYKLRALADGYIPKEFSIRVDPGQTEVALQAALVRTPARLTVSTNLASLAFSLDGESRVLSGSEERTWVPLRVMRDKSLVLELAPGRVSLEAGSGAARVVRALDMASGSSTRVEILAVPGKKEYELRVSE